MEEEKGGAKTKRTGTEEEEIEQPMEEELEATKPVAMRKESEFGGLDRLSILHDSILTNILSFLPTKEAVRTCILAKRWLHTWRSVPALDFSVNQPSDIALLKHVREHYSSLCISRFHLCCKYLHADLYNEMDACFHFAIKHYVRDIKLQVAGLWRLRALDSLFNYQLLESLELHGHLYVDKKLSNRVQWTNLRVLCLDLDGMLAFGLPIGEIISSCPVLQDLRLVHRCGSLRLSNPSLKRLRIELPEIGPDEISISCSRLDFFELEAFYCGWNFEGNMPSLVKAHISLVSYEYDVDEALNKILPSLHNVTELRLINDGVKIGPEYLLEDPVVQQPAFSNLRSLQLDSCFVDGSSIFLHFLLDHCPNLNSFRVVIEPECHFDNTKENRSTRKLSLKILDNLRKVCLVMDKADFVKFHLCL